MKCRQAEAVQGIPQWFSGEESACIAGDAGDVGSVLVRKIPWRRAWQPTPAFLPGESYGLRSLGIGSIASQIVGRD